MDKKQTVIYSRGPKRDGSLVERGFKYIPDKTGDYNTMSHALPNT